ncbi:hypothetical protein N7456_006725 [Penicillium angulare]|uniref:Uncharacterized protein n=1 Tax=Penicillium angulare TaxID=116970 RepID=A0A9W9FI65_9EURO|nr:hypothetical protein N7456_006725 [Penicillium angulare]
MAQLFIHPMKLSEFRKDECGLPDSRALDIYEALKAQGVDVDPTLNPGDHKIPPADSTDLTVYGILLQSSQLLEEGYRLGFTDIDRPTLWEFEGGMTPLCWRCDEFRQVSEIDFVLSLLSKGANLFQSLSQMGTKPQSKTTAVHLLNARLAELLSQDDDYHYKELSQFIEDNQSRFWQFLGNHLFSLSHRDSCSCACSAGGCTPLSVSIRLRMDWWDPDEQFFHLSCKMKHFLEFLIDWNQSRPQVSREIIRSLTFDGLGLRHSCCTEIKGGEPFWCTRDESELHDIMDEQKGLIEQLDQLVSEFEAQFDALQLPLMEFLRDIWYHGMMKFHSECDAFDEEHHIEAGRLGISLEVDDGPIPLIVQLLGPGLQELDTTDEEEEEEE